MDDALITQSRLRGWFDRPASPHCAGPQEFGSEAKSAGSPIRKRPHCSPARSSYAILIINNDCVRRANHRAIRAKCSRLVARTRSFARRPITLQGIMIVESVTMLARASLAGCNVECKQAALMGATTSASELQTRSYLPSPQQACMYRKDSYHHKLFELLAKLVNVKDSNTHRRQLWQYLARTSSPAARAKGKLPALCCMVDPIHFS